MINNLTYLINNTLLFSPEDGVLSLKDDQKNSELLSKPAARLFNELIRLYHNGHLATRDELLINVWENYGLVGSNNNLNTYISEIRKKIENLGENPRIIVTIPKKGFRLEGEITEYLLAEDSSLSIDKNQTIADPQINSSNDNNTDDSVKTYQSIIDNHHVDIITQIPDVNTNPFNPHKIRVFKRSIKNKTLTVIIIIMIFLYSLFLFVSKDHFSFTQLVEYNELTKIDHCSLQVSPQRNRTLDNYDITMIKKILNENNISCSQGDKFVFLSYSNTSIDINGDYFIGICDAINNKKMNCISINQQRL